MMLFCILSFIAAQTFAESEKTLEERYRAADNYSHYGKGSHLGNVHPKWIKGTGDFWYLCETGEGKQFFLVRAGERKKELAFDHEKLAELLGKEWQEAVDPRHLPFSEIQLSDNLEQVDFTAKEFPYRFDKKSQTLARKDIEHPSRNREREHERNPNSSPDGKWEAYIQDCNVFLRETATGKTTQLSYDGTSGEKYDPPVKWSSDSRHFVVCKSTVVSPRTLTLIESSPRDQLQPRLRTVSYPKPGDVLPITRPVLFDAVEKSAKEIAFPNPEQQYAVQSVDWSKSGKYFTFEYNKRGHGEYIVYRVDVPDPVAKPVVDEKSDTFIYYFKLYRHYLWDKDELLWISERNGWRNLYLIDVPTGKVKRAVTDGNWVVKQVLWVDEQKRRVYFIGCGETPGEDPYLEKLYVVSLDEGKPTCLTPENANHQLHFSPDNKYFVDISSRVDLPPFSTLRSTETGEVLLKLDESDISPALAKGWQAPQVFSAKGRDGETDIWGVVAFPPDFQKGKKYPVIEYIYAGPHDSFVPKTFRFENEFSRLTELGFIMVMIDGMGTYNRSKKFHDVCWQNIKDSGFPDRIAWMKAAAEKYPEMDLSRVGIYGMSAGGQSSMGAVLFHPEFYKVAVSSSGCHDNRMDKMWWNEQWMGYPIGKQYEESSNVVNAHRLEGKLMLIFGELDDNVDPSSTNQVLDALIKADKDFEYYLVPGAGHTMGEKFGERKRRDFFVRYLLHLDPPDWNKISMASVKADSGKGR